MKWIDFGDVVCYWYDGDDVVFKMCGGCVGLVVVDDDGGVLVVCFVILSGVEIDLLNFIVVYYWFCCWWFVFMCLCCWLLIIFVMCWYSYFWVWGSEVCGLYVVGWWSGMVILFVLYMCLGLWCCYWIGLCLIL